MDETATATRWLSIVEAAAYIEPPRERDTIWRWITKGIKTPAGQVKLKADPRGGFWMTKPEWIEEFFADIKRAKGLGPVAESPAAEARRDRLGVEKALRDLKRR